MLGDAGLAFSEFVMQEDLPLATLHAAILELLRDRDDVVLFGAQAVNAYVPQPRSTQDIDVVALDAAAVAEAARAHLSDRFRIAARVRAVSNGLAFRVYQLRQPSNRHLLDVRGVTALPAYRRVSGIQVMSPPTLIAAKVTSAAARSKTAKGMTDLADLRRLLLVFPDLKTERGLVRDELEASGAPRDAVALWHRTVAEEILPDDDDAPY